MAKMALTSDGNLHARFFIEMGANPLPPQNEFDYWLDEAPYMETGGNGEFDYWIEGAPFGDL